MGFFFMCLVYFAIGIPYGYWRQHTNVGFLFLYGLTFFFANFGPNTTTFIVPAELFPARFRSTCHGISGAMGKIGELIGSLGVLWASKERDNNDVTHEKPMRSAMVVFGVVCVVGMGISYLFTPETMGRSLEENEKENDDENNEHSFFGCFTGSSRR